VVYFNNVTLRGAEKCFHFYAKKKKAWCLIIFTSSMWVFCELLLLLVCYYRNTKQANKEGLQIRGRTEYKNAGVFCSSANY